MEIGEKVRVRRLRDRVGPAVIEKLGKLGTVQGYKMVDGSGIGVMVKFDDQATTWFFEDEVELVRQ